MIQTNYFAGEKYHNLLRSIPLFKVKGKVERIAGVILRAKVPYARIGDLCLLRCPDHGWERYAEVVGLEPGIALLSPMGEMDGISFNTEVIMTGRPYQIAVGDQLMGCILDGYGNPGTGSLKLPTYLPLNVSVNAAAPNPMTRKIIHTPMSVGVRAIDGLLTCAEGQRTGIFAAAGVGKTSLLSMLIKGSTPDVYVIALIGERGREVREFIERDLGPEDLKKTVVVVATSDRPASERLKAGLVATTVAEYFRDQGKRVLLVVDSITRLARAQREIGLAIGEAPTRQGFPPSVFSLLPRVFERAGMNDKGSITAFYTVLVEGDDMTEPVADEVRSLLDGHIILSRELASENHYPAIDVLASVSRVMNNVVTPEHRRLAARMRQLLAKHKEIELLVRLGEYQAGNDAEGDEAVKKIDNIKNFLQQPLDSILSFEKIIKGLQTCLA
ncbi:type III secretion system ATPase SctN [Glaciimonas sp. GG7]